MARGSQPEKGTRPDLPAAATSNNMPTMNAWQGHNARMFEGPIAGAQELVEVSFTDRWCMATAANKRAASEMR